jgi:hypothetical protein
MIGFSKPGALHPVSSASHPLCGWSLTQPIESIRIDPENRIDCIETEIPVFNLSSL